MIPDQSQGETPAEALVEPESPKRRLAWVGFALGLLSFVTCGMTAIPGLLISLSALFWKSGRIVAGIGLGSSVLGLLFAFPLTDWHPDFAARIRVNVHMRMLGLPSLPSSSGEIKMTSWSFLASRYTLVRFDLPEADADDFFTRLGVSPIDKIGTGEGEVQVVTLDRLTELSREESAALLENRPSEFKLERYHAVPTGYCRHYPWFSPQQIRKGRFYAGPVPEGSDGMRLDVFYDRDTGTMFFAWTGS